MDCACENELGHGWREESEREGLHCHVMTMCGINAEGLRLQSGTIASEWSRVTV
jgi:hypothetical protein